MSEKETVKNTKFSFDRELNDKIQSLITKYEREYFPKWEEYFKNFYLDLSDREPYLKNWQSNIMLPLIYTVIMTYHANLYDIVLSFKVGALNEDDQKKVETVKNALTRAYQISDAKEILYESLIDVLVIWNWYTKTTWHEEENLIYKTDKKTWLDKKNFSIEYPTLHYRSPFQIFYNRNVRNFKQAPMVYERVIMSRESIKSIYKKLKVNITDNDLDYITNNAEYFLTNEYDLRKESYAMGSWWLISTIKEQNIDESNTYSIENDDDFFEVVEGRWKNRFFVIINWYKIYDWENPLPLKRIPYDQIWYKKVPWTSIYTWMAQVLLPLQKAWTASLNAYIDEMKLKAVPILTKIAWPTSMKWRTNSLDYEPWDIIPVEEKDAIRPLDWGWANIQLQQLIQFLIELWFQATALWNYTIWWTWQKVERSAQWVLSRTQILKSQLIPLFNMLNNVMGSIWQKWIAMMYAYLDDETIVKIYDEKEHQDVFKKIKLKDLIWQFDVVFDSEALIDAEKDSKVDKLVQYMGYAAQYAVDPTTWLPTIDLVSLLKEVAKNMWISQETIYKDQKEAGDHMEEWQNIASDIHANIQAKMQQAQMATQQQMQWAWMWEAAWWPAAWPTWLAEWLEQVMQWAWIEWGGEPMPEQPMIETGEILSSLWI